MARKCKFEVVADDYFKIGRKLRIVCLTWLKSQLKKIPSMDFSYIDSCISVNYNGENHPEYASNCFSNVEGVYLKDGNIYLHIEDCDQYDIDELTTDEVFDLCDYIKNEYLPNRDEEYENTPIEER